MIETNDVVERDPEANAWDWLDSKFLNIEAGHDPNDRAYDASEMVDAFIAGEERAADTIERLREENARVTEALTICQQRMRKMLRARMEAARNSRKRRVSPRAALTSLGGA